MAMTRREKLLKAILEDNPSACGCGMTREEKMLGKLARQTCENDVLDGNPSGGGLPTGGKAHQVLVTGADGAAKWEDRTHWTENGEVDILPEKTIEISAEGYYGMEPLNDSVTAGDTCQVVWNGTQYECTAFETEGVTILGNGAFGGLDDTGEPFAIVILPDAQAAEAGMYYGILAMDGAAEATVRVYRGGMIYHRIPDEYLPPKTHWVSEEEAEVLAETQPGDMTANEIFFNAELKLMPEVGGTYIVTYNGADYTCEGKDAYNESIRVSLGNMSLEGSSAEDTGEPFLLYVLSPGMAAQVGKALYLKVSNGTATDTIAIREPIGSVHKLDAKFQTIQSVNGKTGKVVLTAKDVGALPVGNVTSVDQLAKAMGVADGGAYMFPVNTSDGTTYKVTTSLIKAVSSRTTFCIYNVGPTSKSKTLRLNINDTYEAPLKWYDAVTGRFRDGLRDDWLKNGQTYRVYLADGNFVIADYSYLSCNNDSGVLIKSSTAGSDKWFRIKVDDDGNITATEMT